MSNKLQKRSCDELSEFWCDAVEKDFKAFEENFEWSL